MSRSIMIVGGLEENRDRSYEVVRPKNKQLNSSKPYKFPRTFILKRIRISAVYALLIGSILLSLPTAIVTYTELRKAPIEQTNMSQLTHEHIVSSSVTRFSSFVLLSLTCTLSLVTIIRR